MQYRSVTFGKSIRSIPALLSRHWPGTAGLTDATSKEAWPYAQLTHSAMPTQNLEFII
jgi:hypothetical protein